MPDAPSPAGPAPIVQFAIVAKTNAAICDQDDDDGGGGDGGDGSLSFLIASAWRFHFISISISFSCFSFFFVAIVMGIMEKIVLHLNNNTRTWQ